MTTSTATTTTTPEAIVDIAIGFMGAKQLFAASRIGLFSALADAPLDAAALSAATGAPERQVRILADSMAAQGLLTREAGRYALTPDAAAYLTGDRAELDLAPFLAFLGATSYPQWLGYDATVDTDAPGVLELDEAGWGAFLAGVMRYNELHAAMLARHFDFTPYRDALDFGGLSPAFAVEGLKVNPELRVRFVFDPQSVEPVREAVEAAGFGDRTAVEGADTADAQPGGSHDRVLVNHVRRTARSSGTRAARRRRGRRSSCSTSSSTTTRISARSTRCTPASTTTSTGRSCTRSRSCATGSPTPAGARSAPSRCPAARASCSRPRSDRGSHSDDAGGRTRENRPPALYASRRGQRVGPRVSPS